MGSVWQRFSPSARVTILRAQSIAVASKVGCVSPAQLFLALMDETNDDSELAALLLAAGLKREEARLCVEATVEPIEDSSEDVEPKLTHSAKRVLELAAWEAKRAGDAMIVPEQQMFGCLHPQRESKVESVLAPLGWELPLLRTKRRELRMNSSVRHPQNPLEHLTGNSQVVVDAAYKAMHATWCGRISTAHLLLGVLEDERVVELIGEVGAPINELKTQARGTIRSDSQLATSDRRFDKGAKRALDRAKKEASSCGYKFIGPEHILLGLLPRRASLRETVTWGHSVPDETAPILAAIDRVQLREVARQVRQKRVAAPKTVSPNVPRKAIWTAIAEGQRGEVVGRISPPDAPRRAIPITFASMFLLGAVQIANLSRTPATARPADALVIALFLVSLVGTAAGACWMLMRSRKPNLKSAWVCAFGGFLVGVFVAMLLFAR